MQVGAAAKRGGLLVAWGRRTGRTGRTVRTMPPATCVAKIVRTVLVSLTDILLERVSIVAGSLRVFALVGMV
jgi:hypothetical protein